MRIAVNGTHDAQTLAGVLDGAVAAAEDGFAGYWLGQAFGADALTALAVAAPHAGDIELGVAVVPIWTRSPQALASQALTVQAATAGRLTLGIGLSHRPVVEGLWGRRFTNVVTRATEYLDALRPLLLGQDVVVRGETLQFEGQMLFDPKHPAPSVLLAAMGPKMLHLAGRSADGTVVGGCGPRTLEEHIIPTICSAATAAGRPAPRIVANAVAVVADDEQDARHFLADRLEAYGQFPSFKSMLAREGVTSQAEIALVGDESRVREQVEIHRATGVTDLVVAELGRTPLETERTRECLSGIAREFDGDITDTRRSS